MARRAHSGVTRRALLWCAQLVVSFVVVAIVISTIQLLAASLGGAAVAGAFAQCPLEAIGFAALASAYVGSSLVNHVTKARPRWERATVNACVVAIVGAALVLEMPAHMPAPAIAYGCAATVQLLEGARVRERSLLASAGMLLPAWLLFGPPFAGNACIAPAVLPFVVTINVAIACGAMSRRGLRIDARYRADAGG